MSKKIQLSINEPCHENWDAMNPVEQGKFCGSCQKNVVDFSIMSDRQVAEFFKKPSTGSVCGRFMSDQLDRDIEIPRKRIPWIKYLFQILLPAFFISKASAQKTVGKVASQARDTSRVSVDQEFRMLGTVARDIIPVCKKDTSIVKIKGEIENVNLFTRQIEGTITDENGDAIPNASVFVKGNTTSTNTDQAGNYSLKVKKNDVLSISAPGFMSNELEVGTANILNVVLKKNGATSTSIAIVAGGVSICRNQSNVGLAPFQNHDKNGENLIVIYPNPVKGGEVINFSLKDFEDGEMEFQIVSLSGQAILKKQIYLEGETAHYSIRVPRVAAGTYFVFLTNAEKQQKFHGKLIIQ